MSVGGRSLIRRTLEAFDRCPEITGITLLISQRNLLEVTRELESDGWRKAIDIRLGGERRQASVRLGLISLKKDPPDFGIVHYGARPLVRIEARTRLVRSVPHVSNVEIALPGGAVIGRLLPVAAHHAFVL